MAIETVFSEYGIRNTSIKIDSDNTYTKVGCVGSFEEAMEVIVISKKCEGVISKKRTRGAGTGELTMSLHMRYDLYTKAFGMVDPNLKEGVYAYGKNSLHKEFSLVAQVEDEDANIKYVAYPRCIMTNGISGKVENGAEEVAEIEITVSVFADDYGYCKYEAPASGLDEVTKGKWMTEFSSDLAQKTTE